MMSGMKRAEKYLITTGLAVLWAAIIALIVFGVVLRARSDPAEPLKTIPPGNDSTTEELVDPTPEEYADIQRWMHITCCWSNNCCKKVKASALEPVVPEPGEKFSDEWTVKRTGQVRRRTGWSQDGQTWRCTCDYVAGRKDAEGVEASGRWVSHPLANTRCIFPAASGS